MEVYTTGKRWAGAHQIPRTSERRSPEQRHSLALVGENPIQEAELLKSNEYEEFVLLQNDPNPFADYTDIQLTLPNSAKNASLLIVNMKGSVMLNVPLYGGSETIRVYSSDIGKGIFTYYLLNEGNVVASRKMVSSK